MLLTVALLRIGLSQASAQDLFFRRTQLSDAVQVDEVTSTTLAHLERIDAFAGDQQWSEVVDTLNRVTSQSGDKLIPLADTGDQRDDPRTAVGSQRYVPVGLWCQMRLAEMAGSSPEVLRLYRAQVDPLAKSWFTKAMQDHDENMLTRIVDELYCSSYGDDALLALGEIALERRQPSSARYHWERISPKLRAGLITSATEEKDSPATFHARPLWLEHLQHRTLSTRELVAWSGSPFAFPAYPDTDLNLAGVRARLVLASIYERSTERAAYELQLLKDLHPRAQGKLRGKTVEYHSELSKLLEQSRKWPFS